MGVWKSDHTVITAKGMQLLSDLAGKKPHIGYESLSYP